MAHQSRSAALTNGSPPTVEPVISQQTRTRADSESDSSEKDVSGVSTPTGSLAAVEAEKLGLASRKQPYEIVTGPVTDAVYHYLHIRRRKTSDLDETATQPSVFDSDQAEFYRPRDDWENIEAFDPHFRWTWREERKAISKVDRKVFLWILVMFFSLNMQRSNITNATADTFLKDLRLTQADYNLGFTIFRVAFLVAELPSQLISKRLGPDVWIPMQIVAYSIIGASQFWLSDRGSYIATRFLMALFQGGMIPDFILYLSYWYNQHDLPIRLAFFFTMNFFSGMVTNFLAVGLIEMSGVLGYAGWRWMFLINGLITLIIGIISFFMMPAAPTATKSKWRPKGYFTDREVKIIVNRTIRDDPGKGGMHNRQPLTLRLLWKAITDWHLWPLYLISLLFHLPTFPVSNYLQIQFRSLGFSRPITNLLAVPNTVLSIITIIAITLVSEAVSNRAFVAQFQNIWLLPPLVALVVMKTINGWQYFAIATVFLSYPWVHAIQVGWTSTNSGSVHTRTVSAALYNMSIQVSSIIGANMYQASDAPRYFTANKILIGVCVFNIVFLYPGTWYFYRRVNQKRDATWNALTSEQKSEYLRNTKDEGNKRLDFRFAN